MSLPQSNATLTKVTGGGGSADWDHPASEGPDRWIGSYAAYFMEKRERIIGAEGSNIEIRRVLIVETSLRDWSAGETVHFTFEGEDKVGQVQSIGARSLAAAGPLATTRLTLEVT